ncbi:MAG: hypothetical protein KBT47_02870, partial [Armatimonadetes bacterium]|nr:hypothetical protein [Candidatus Hippobium faecium]
DYKQEYKYNIAVVKGDNYDVCKKYRKWGIDNKFIPFAMGRFADRKDIPNWWKDICVWLCCDIYDKKDYSTDWTIDAVRFLDMQVGIHLYQWSENIYDTHYPNMLPARENVKDDLPRLCENNVIIMPYTNGHIVDRAQSDWYTKFGDTLLLEKENGNFVKSPYQSVNTENMEACPASDYQDCYYNEAMNVLRTLKPDALYTDQLGSTPAETCFSDEHRHAPGGGDFWTKTYNNLLNKIRKDINAEREEPIIMTTECSAEVMPVDAWLACAEWGDGLTDTNSQMYVFSGYRAKFGVIVFEEEMNRDDSLPAINKTAVALCKGYQLGWQLTNEGSGGNLVCKYPKFGNHLKDAAHARYAGREYFNLGEMVRPVKFINDIPTRDIWWKYYGEEKTRAYPTVRTCSYYYKGKTMVCLSSVNPDSDTEVSFEANPSDLYLKNKSSYT